MKKFGFREILARKSSHWRLWSTSKNGGGHYLNMSTPKLEHLEDRCVPATLPVLVADLNPGPASSNPKEFVRYRDTMVVGGFSPGGAADGLWQLPGGSGTARYLNDLPFVANDLKWAGSQIFFWDAARKNLWQANPSIARVHEVFAFTLAGDGLTYIFEPIGPTTAIGQNLYLAGRQHSSASASSPYDNGIEPLWLEGKPAAQYVSNLFAPDLIQGDGQGSNPNQFTDLNGSAIFALDTAYPSLHRIVGGQRPGETIVGFYFDPSTETSTVSVVELERLGNEVLFTTDNNQLWRTDGNYGGSAQIVTLPKPMQHLTNAGSRIFMTAAGAVPGSIELWQTDGTTAGTGAIATLAGTNVANFSGFFPDNGRAFFLWDDGQNGRELWVTDGTAAGTHLVKDIRPGSTGDGIIIGSTNRSDPVVAAGKLYFVADDGLHGKELWVSDGTPGGTEMVVDSIPGPSSGNPAWLTAEGGALYLSMYDAAVGYEPFVIGQPDFFAPRTDLVSRVGETGDWYAGISDGTKFATAYWSTWAPGATWANVQTGDFNGDGRADIIGRYVEANEIYVGISTGSGYVTGLWATWDSQDIFKEVLVLDLNGDGRDDVVGHGISHFSNGSEFDYFRAGFSLGDHFQYGLWRTPTLATQWVNVLAGDFNADGQDDIVVRDGPTGQWWAGYTYALGNSYIDASFEPLAAWSTGVTWSDIRVADLNGDHRDDLIGRWNESGQWWSVQSGATSAINAYWGNWTPGITWSDVGTGDFNGDGRADIVGRWLETGQWWVGESNGTGFQNRYFGQWTASISWVDIRVGDFDGDGKSDLVGRWNQTGQWYVARSTGNSFSNQLWATWSSQVTWKDSLTDNFAS